VTAGFFIELNPTMTRAIAGHSFAPSSMVLFCVRRLLPDATLTPNLETIHRNLRVYSRRKIVSVCFKSIFVYSPLLGYKNCNKLIACTADFTNK
jgi:hypothetical protein